MTMSLKVLLPSRIFFEKTDVLRIVAETPNGAFGLLPHRLDCVAALAAGILTVETNEDGEFFIAVDEGVFVKAGSHVFVSVRRAQRGNDLEQLRNTVEQEYLSLNESEQNARMVMAKLETGFLRRLSGLLHE